MESAQSFFMEIIFRTLCFFSGYELIFILVGQFCKIDINFDQYLKPLKSHMWLFQAPSSVESKLVRCKKDEPTIHFTNLRQKGTNGGIRLLNLFY